MCVGDFEIPPPANKIKRGNLTAKNSSFGQITKLEGISFIAAKFDGILGMGWPAISVERCPLIFDLLYKQGQVSSNSFSFYLTKKAG